MKLSELRPCDSCNGPLIGKGPTANPLWYVVRVTQAVVSQKANQVMGLAQYFNGDLGLAEVMAPEPDKAVLVLGDENKELLTELFLCMECAVTPRKSVAILVEKRQGAIAEQERKKREPDAADLHK